MEKMMQLKFKPKFFISIYACCLFVFFAREAIAGESDASPSIQVTQNAHEFSPVITGTEVEHRFTLCNTGTAALDIINVYTGWGCLVASYPRRIPPGGTGEVTLKIKTEGEAGNFVKKTATVYTNAPDHATIVLTLTGKVLFPADITPKAARLMGEAGQKITAEIAITPSDLNPFDILSATAEDGTNIQFQMEKKTYAGKRFFTLLVKNRKAIPIRYFDKIILKTTSTLSPELQVRVYGIIRDASPNDAGGL